MRIKQEDEVLRDLCTASSAAIANGETSSWLLMLVHKNPRNKVDPDTNEGVDEGDESPNTRTKDGLDEEGWKYKFVYYFVDDRGDPENVHDFFDGIELFAGYWKEWEFLLSDKDDNDDDDDETSTVSTREDDHGSRRVAKGLFCVTSLYDTGDGVNDERHQLVGSPGWKEAMKIKYRIITAKLKRQQHHSNQTQHGGVMDNMTTAVTCHQENDKENAHPKHNENSKVVAGAVSAGVVGGGAAMGGTALAVEALGFTGTGIAAGSYAAAAMSAEAIATGGGVAAGGVTATLQSVGAVGVMAASPAIGISLLTVGAASGVAAYYGYHKRKQKQKQLSEAGRAMEEARNILDEGSHQGDQVVVQVEETAQQGLVQKDANEDEPVRSAFCPDNWTILIARRGETGPSAGIYEVESYSCKDQTAAVDRFLDASNLVDSKSILIAKAMFAPSSDTPNPMKLYSYEEEELEDVYGGWETALRLHYTYLLKGTSK